MADEMVIFTRTFDLLTWLLPAAERLPKSQRFGVTRRLLDAAFDFQERIIEANVMSGGARAALLRQADADLRRLKLYLRLAHKWRWLSNGQYRHVSQMIAEIGRLLGGWIKQTQKG